MAKLNRYSVMFNGAGAVIALIVGTYVVRDLLHTEQMPACSQRYPAPSSFTLESAGGVPLSSIELQARAGMHERGVLEYARAVRVEGAPAETLLEVALARRQGSGRVSAAEASGVSFGWQPPEFAGASAACLSYRVWLPDDFLFGTAGTLPGMTGGEPSDTAAAGDKRTSFAARPVWREGGTGEVLVQLPLGAAGQTVSIDRGKFSLPRGRWVPVEQEMVLNTPGKADGILRLWVDGVLRSQHTAVRWRDEDTALITGVAADIGYGTPDRRAAAPQDTALRFTPFELRWR